MKILYITAEGFDSPNPNNQMAEVMIKEFIKKGHFVHLIQSHKKGINPDVPNSLRSLNNLKIDTIKRKVVDKTKFIKRYLNDFKYSFLAMKYWKKVKDVDVIYLQSNPTIIYHMILLKLFKRKTPIVYSIYDVFPGHALSIGVIKSKFIYNTLRLIQKPCYKMATAITVLSEDMKEKIYEEGAKREKIFVVPAWYDISTTEEISYIENKFFKKYNLKKDKFCIQFAGTIGYVFNYKTVLELAKRLLNFSDIEIQIIGDGNVKNDFMNEAKQVNLTNISFYPLQPVEIVPDVYSACDVCLIPLKKGVIGNGVPSKAPILMACKRVIINSVEINSNYAKMFLENNMGLAIDIFDYDGLANAVLDLKKSPEKIKFMANNAYEFVKNHYSSDKSIKKILDIFEKVE